MREYDSKSDAEVTKTLGRKMCNSVTHCEKMADGVTRCEAKGVVLNLQKDRGEILRYLGYRGGEIDENTEINIAQCIDEVNDVATVRTTWKLCKLQSDDAGTPGVWVDRQCFLPGESIGKHLRGCSMGVLLGVTVGNAVDEAINRLMVTNPAKGVIMNACAIALVEKAADNLQKEIDNRLENDYLKKIQSEKDYLKKDEIQSEKDYLKADEIQSEKDYLKADEIQSGAKTGIRFSPGYGDLPIETQVYMAKMLDLERRIGVRVNSNMMMNPVKSVTAIAGIVINN